MNTDGSFDLAADAPDGAVKFISLPKSHRSFMAAKESVGRRRAAGHASHYYSITRLGTIGSSAFDGRENFAVTGESWFDHEWATNQLAADQAGWNWLSAQFEDGTS